MALKNFMARGELGNETAMVAPEPVLPSAPATRTVSPATSVDASSEFEGKLRCKEILRIDGCIKGEVECEKSVLVGQGAMVHASIAADEVQISGFVEGNIAARRKITLQRTAVVSGDLTTPGIVIEEGAKLQGRIVIGSDAESETDSESAKDAKKIQASGKPQAASPTSGKASSPQPVAATA